MHTPAMNDSDRLRRLAIAFYKFRDEGIYRDLPNREGDRKMKAKAYSELLSTFADIEREQGIDPGLMTAERRAHA